jgi:hypothetical protein
MKVSFNIIRPIIFFICGLGYLPLQSADHIEKNHELSSKNYVLELESKEKQSLEKKNLEQEAVQLN